MTAEHTTRGLPGYAEHFEEPAGYLDFARFGPPSRQVLAATAAALERAARPDHTTVDGLMAAEPRAREAAARLAGTDVAHTVLLPNASTGLFHAAFGIGRGTVLVPTADFPANHYPWRRSAGLGRAVPRWLTPDRFGRITPGTVRAALTDEVVALAVSAVDFRTGARADLAALREAIGPDRLLVVDAMQGFGVVDLPWSAADVVVTGGQKWLRAGWATGFATLSDRALERLEPTLTGWTGVRDVADFDDTEHPPAPDAQRWSVTNLSPVTAAALAAALQVVESVTVPAIEAQVARRLDQLTEVIRGCGGESLSPTAPDQRAGIVSFRLPGTDPAAVAEALRAHEVTPSVRGTAGGTPVVRLSVHASTPLAAVERVQAALRSRPASRG